MRQDPDVATLPPSLATFMRPWLEVVRVATPGMGEEVRSEAENVSAHLRYRLMMTAPLETMLEDAEVASRKLALTLDLRHALPARARADALNKLQNLIVWLQGAKPNARTKALGLGW
ncbi:MAG: hypothetical protein EKK49_07365 [Rhodocyclaceae bacterium]|nr:MAG: hypothetical protein EKK49_07365 [Rhodocyclaceae bacterium]